MSQEERTDAAYQHTVIRYYASGGMTNSSLRERFGMTEKQRAQISRLIKEAQDKGKIKPKDAESKSDKFSVLHTLLGLML